MENNKDKARIDELRKRAEKILTGKPEDIGDLAPADVQRLIQELNVHQIELELQNEDLRRTQLELQEARDKYLNLYNYAPTGYHTLDSNGIMVDVNFAGCELLGSEKHRLTGTQFTRFISPESQDAFYFHRRELIKTGTKSSCELKMLKVDGTPFHAQLISSAISQDDRKTNHHLIAVIDISERKRAEEALRESEQRFFRLANNAQDMIYRFLTVSKRKFEYVSPASTIVTGYTPEEYYADPDLGFKMVHPDDHMQLCAYLRDTVSWKESIVVRWIRKDGTLIWTEQRNVPIYDHKGELFGLEGIARDITQRKLMEEEIHRKEVEIAASIETDRLKTQLLATVSHELRTPLASIKGYATTLMDYDKRLKLAEKRQCLELIDQATDRLTELIDHLIDMSRLDAGPFRLSKAPTKMDKLIDQAVIEAQVTGAPVQDRVERRSTRIVRG